MDNLVELKDAIVRAVREPNSFIHGSPEDWMTFFAVLWVFWQLNIIRGSPADVVKKVDFLNEFQKAGGQVLRQIHEITQGQRRILEYAFERNLKRRLTDDLATSDKPAALILRFLSNAANAIGANLCKQDTTYELVGVKWGKGRLLHEPLNVANFPGIMTEIPGSQPVPRTTSVPHPPTDPAPRNQVPQPTTAPRTPTSPTQSPPTPAAAQQQNMTVAMSTPQIQDALDMADFVVSLRAKSLKKLVLLNAILAEEISKRTEKDDDDDDTDDDDDDDNNNKNDDDDNDEEQPSQRKTPPVDVIIIDDDDDDEQPPQQKTQKKKRGHHGDALRTSESKKRSKK